MGMARSIGESGNPGSVPFPRLGVRSATGLLALLLVLWPLRRVSAENRAEYRYADYSEDADRMQVRTHSVWFEYELHEKVGLRGSYVNDAISGATPTGGLGYPGEVYESVKLKDERNAGFVETAIRTGRFTTTPQLAYSEEIDYRSVGLSLTEAIDFNQRNTTLILGVARNSDEVSGFWQRKARYKGSWDFLLGLNQILGPSTVLTLNFTLGYADGYLTDPYKGVSFVYDLPPYGPYDPDNANFDAIPYGANGPEVRPSHKFKQVFHASLTQKIARLDAAIEGTLRTHHDDWGVWAQTAQVTWNQRIGSRVTVSPLFRYHYQSAADFFVRQVSTDPLLAGSRVAFTLDDQFYAVEGDGVFESDVATNPGGFQVISVPALPNHYSADYRLSELQTFTFGVSVTVKVHEHVSITAGYQRYDMQGLDGVTPQAVYPDAHVFTVGLGASF
jgi:hypothetical protein